MKSGMKSVGLGSARRNNVAVVLGFLIGTGTSARRD